MKICKTCNWHILRLCEKDYSPTTEACEDYIDKRKRCINCNNYKACEIAFEQLGVDPTKMFCPAWAKLRPIVTEPEEVGVSNSKSDFYDPFSLIKEVIDSDFDPSIFDMIDDRELPLAPNSIEFLTGKDYLNLTLYPRQMEIALEAFSDYCPKCSDTTIIGQLFDQSVGEIFDRIQLLEFGVCPKCGKSRNYWIRKGHYSHHNEIIGIAGQRSGKSVVSAAIANYLLHWYLKIPNPSHYFGLLPNSMLHMTFVAITYGQAEDTLWAPFTSFYEASPWFRSYNDLLNHYGTKYNRKFFNYKSTFLTYHHKRLFVSPAGPDKRILRGRTRVLSVCDEICWFDFLNKNLKKINADEVDIALRRSLRTIRSASARARKEKPHVPDAWNINISSPSAARDKGMQLLKEAKHTKTMYSFHRATWEMNPTITKSDLASEFRNDPVGALRDYGAVPPLSSAPFISNPDVVKKLVDPKLQSMIRSSIRRHQDKTGITTIYKVPHYTYIDKSIPLILTADAGFSNNSFAIVLQHRDFNRDACVIDGVIEIKPSKEEKVNFPKVVEEILIPLAKNLPVCYFASDTWQNIMFNQTLGEHGIRNEAYSLTPDDFQNIYNYVMGRNIIFPKPEAPFKNIIDPNTDYDTFFSDRPIAHALLQLLTVQTSGRKVIKGTGYDDDIFRAWALGVSILMREENEHIFRSIGTSVNRRISTPALAVVGGRASRQLAQAEVKAESRISSHNAGLAIGGRSR